MKKLYPSTVAVTENYKQILLIRTSYFLKYRCLGVIVPGGNYPRWELSRSNCTLQRSIVQGVIICGQLSRGIYPGGIVLSYCARGQLSKGEFSLHPSKICDKCTEKITYLK